MILESGSSWPLITLIALIGLSTLFSMSETALMSLSKIRIRNMQETGVKGADRIVKLMENPNKLLSAVLVGNNIVNICASSLATVIVQKYFKDNAVAISTGVMTFLLLVFGEITPKTLAAQNSEKVSLKVSGFILVCVKIFSPIIFVLTKITGGLITLLGGNKDKETPLITEAELKTLVDVGHEEGVLEQEERKMINNVFDFGDIEAEDVMVTRMDIIAADIGSSYNEIFKLFKEEGFSRMPIYEDNIDNIVGILNFRDFILTDNKKNFNIKDHLREPYFTYESKPTAELFSAMQSKRIPMAIVLDEYGGTSGLITIEDLVEQIVGEIDDEYDEPKEEIKCIKEDEYIIDGSVKIEDVNEMIGTRLESDDFESIGGYIIGILGRFPKSGEELESEGIRFIVEEVDKNRVEKVRVIT